MSLLSTLRFIANHPLSSRRPLAAYARFAKWQIESRLKDEVVFHWIGDAKLVVRNGMTGATGNIYCGLHEFADMALLLHLLREGDLFVDVGANIGSYTILASAVCQAQSIAFEPDPGAAKALRRNVEASGVSHRVDIFETAAGASSGSGRLSVGHDTTNRMMGSGEAGGQVVALKSLDEVLADKNPTLIKIDVEGFEPEVMKGARDTLSKSSLRGVIIETVTPEIDAAFMDQGFVRAHYDPLKRNLSLHVGSPPSDGAGNTLYVRGEDLAARLRAARIQNIAGVLL